jgi:SAM-dependent methyltransferase
MQYVDQHDFVTLTREGYDRTAVAYAERFHHHLDDKPVDLAMVAAFAGLIRKGANKRVVDVGCGTGVTTALLDSCGVESFGIDLSANMIAQARRLNPDLTFSVGSMMNLDVADGSLGGVCAWYSVIHVPDEHLAGVLSEFYRVLTGDGLVLLAFQVGDKPRVLTSAFGYDVDLTFIRRQPRHVEEHLACAGFRICAQLVRQPDDDGFESTPQAYLIARKI